MSTQQGLRQTSFRAIGGTAGTYNGDARAAFEAEATVPAGATFNGAFYAWLEVRLGLSNSGRTLDGLKTQFAILNGAHNWSSLGLFDANGPGGVIDGLAFWYRADTAADFDDPDAIGQWIDKTPDGTNHAIQATEANQPRLAVPIESNGRLAVRCDGINDVLSVTQPPNLSAGVTILTVYHVWTRTDFDGVVSVGDDATNDVDSFFAFQLNTAASGDMQLFRDAAVDLVVLRTDTERINLGLMTVVDTPGAGELRDEAGSGSAAFTDAIFGTPDQIRLGARQTAAGVASWLEVDLYEVACWVPARDTADLDAIDAYAVARYGLSTAVVPARPLTDAGGAMLNASGGFMHL